MNAEAFWESLRRRELLPGEQPYPSLVTRLVRALRERWLLAVPVLAAAVIGVAFLL